MGRLLDEDTLLANHARFCGQRSCAECNLIAKEYCDIVAAVRETPTAIVKLEYDVQSLKKLQLTNHKADNIIKIIGKL